MNNTKVIREVNILKFINVNDKTIKHESIVDLVKDGLVTQYYFIYTNPKDKTKSKYKSDRIRKLDLYHKIVVTTSGRTYKILDDIDINPKKIG